MLKFLKGLLVFIVMSMPSVAVAQTMHDNVATYSDRNFLSGMIGHHQAAVDMSEQILITTKDPKVKTWAQNIITAQKKEILMMQDMLKDRGGIDEKVAKSMNAASMPMHRPAEELGQISKEMGKEMSGHMMKSMPAEANTDKVFVSDMLLHHKMALDMAAEALAHSKDKVVLDLSKQILIDQTGEMREFKDWLSDIGEKHTVKP